MAGIYLAGRLAILPAFLILLEPKGCPPSPADDDTSPGPGEESPAPEEPQPTPPGPPPRVPLQPSELGPFDAGDSRAAAAASLRAAVAASAHGDAETALRELGAAVTAAPSLAPAIVAWERGSALRRQDRNAEAELAFAAIPEGSRLFGEARLQRAALMLEGGRAGESLTLLDGIAGDERQPGLLLRAEVLRSRALRARGGQGDEDAAYLACKRVWLQEGRSSAALAEAQATMELLCTKVDSSLLPTLKDRVDRASALARAGANDSVLALLKDDESALRAAGDSERALACQGLLELGRAWFKKKDYGKATPLLKDATLRCTPGGDPGARAQYLLAQALARTGARDAAVAAFLVLAESHQGHSYADDGLYHAGGLLLDDARPEEARPLYARLVQDFPQGDMVQEALWGLAWTSLVARDREAALPWLERLASGDAGGAERASVLLGRFWLGRTLLEGEPAERARGSRTLQMLAREAPLDWYGVLAWTWLARLDAAAAAAAADEARASLRALCAGATEPGTFSVDPEFMARPGARESVDLLRAGLPELAREEIAWALGEKPHERWDRETLLFASHLLERADDLHRSHDLLRRAFMASYPALVSGNRPLFLHAWPRAFSAEVDAAARPYSWPPLLLQGLVREESAFSPAITSSAGAVGLTQLMWPTAKETARRMGRKLSRAELEIPAQNLEIGARYFDGLVSRWQGQLPLAVASYNAGPGAVSRWLDERGDLELAGFVETIPYDETRNYVKRVVGSWQAYHALHGADDGAPFVALEVGPVAAAVKAGAAPKAAGTGEPVNY